MEYFALMEYFYRVDNPIPLNAGVSEKYFTNANTGNNAFKKGCEDGHFTDNLTFTFVISTKQR